MRVDGKIIAEAFGSLHIQNNSVALSEQIKNAVDAQATEINFDFIENNTKKRILITENGVGMSKETFKSEWNTIGDSSKKDDVDALGGKGIGRFTLFRLANKIKIYTKTKDSDPCMVMLDYEDVLKQSDISQYNFKVQNISEEEWKSNTPYSHGTIIILDEISRNINYIKILQDLENFNEPFTTEKIKINITLPKQIEEQKFMSCYEATKFAPFNIKATFENGEFTNCLCSVRGSNGKIKKQQPYNLEKLNKDFFKRLVNEEEDLDFPRSELVKFKKIEIYIDNFFFKNEYVNAVHIKNNIKELKDNFLSAYQGINIYRNNVKIFGFGKNDFLKLAEKRLKKAGDNIDNKLTFGYVSLSKETKSVLCEQTNREGFIQDDFYKAFIKLIDIIADILGDFRKENIPYIQNQQEDEITEPFINVNLVHNMTIRDDQMNQLQELISQQIKSSIESNIDYNKITINVDLNTFDPTILTEQAIPVTIAANSEDSALQKKCQVKITRKMRTYKKQVAILYLDQELYGKIKIKHTKLASIIEELSRLNVYELPNSCAFSLRSLIEITLSLYIKKYCDKYSSLNLKYDDKQEEVRDTRSSQGRLKESDRVKGAFKILELEKAAININENTQHTLLNGLKNIDFIKHKDKKFCIPSNLIQFYNEILPILNYILDDITK